MRRLLFLILFIAVSCGREWRAPTEPPPDGLVAYYPFNGNANDASRHRYDGVSYGVVYSNDRFDKPNRACSFDGVNDYIAVQDFAAGQELPQSITLCVWINIAGWYNDWAVICSKSNGLNRWQFRAFVNRPRNIYFSLNNVDIIVGQTDFNMNTWYFITAIYTGGKVQCYVDGKSVGEKSFTIPFYENDYPLEIGRDTPFSTEYFKGYMDDLRIYYRALSLSEIEQLYHEGGYGY